MGAMYHDAKRGGGCGGESKRKASWRDLLRWNRPQCVMVTFECGLFSGAEDVAGCLVHPGLGLCGNSPRRTAVPWGRGVARE
jgi:hypothetical protein